MRKIFIVQLHNNSCYNFYDFLTFHLGLTFNANIQLIKQEKISLDFAFHPQRKQYSSSKIINKLKYQYFNYPGKILFIVSVDLFVSPFNFIFGQAELGGKFAIVSLARLKEPQSSHNLNPSTSINEIIFKQRVLKESIHELGHTFNLKHCKDTKCVMSFSNSLKDTDLKDSKFCERCKKLLFPCD